MRSVFKRCAVTATGMASVGTMYGSSEINCSGVGTLCDQGERCGEIDERVGVKSEKRSVRRKISDYCALEN
nr:MAG TPA: hypothetical protein [Caudoviricetes sp.]